MSQGLIADKSHIGLAGLILGLHQPMKDVVIK